jgi:hypothetical protein
VVASAHVRGIAPAASQAEAGARLYQALYGCTMHPAGLLHAIAACLDAEVDDTYTLAGAAADAEAAARHALERATSPDQAWRYEVIIALCHRLSTTSPS